MSPRSGRKRIAQGEVSAANETLGIGSTHFPEPALAGDRVFRPLKRACKYQGGAIPGFRFAPPEATICHSLRGFV